MAHSLISNTVGQLAQTVLVESSTSEEDHRELRVYRKMTRFTAFLAMPLMFGLALVSREFILITIGAAWLDCVPLLQMLCISGAFMPLYVMYQNLAISQGRSDIYMWLNIIQIVLQIAIILACAPFGMPVMVAAYSLFMIAWLLPWHLYAGRFIHYRWRDAFADVAPFAAIAILAMSITYLATMWTSSIYLLLPLRILIATVAYYTALRLLGAEILNECMKYLRKR